MGASLPAVLGLLALMAAAHPAASSPASPAQQQVAAVVVGGDDASRADQELWWHHAVIYQIYPRSFKDSNGDGIGDLKGITSKLGYLKDLGVGAIWLSPFYKSPQADFGYDISDFKDVDPKYGTLTDFKEMVDTAHGLGIKVVVDLVPNHSSDEHEWFKKSVNKEGNYTDYYVWNKGKFNNLTGKYDPPNNWVSYFRFTAWEYNEQRKEYYLHLFAKKQPDLNYRNENVVQEMKDVYTFWMNQGVDGFRVDALPFLFENNYDLDELEDPNHSPDFDDQDTGFYKHPYTMDLPETYDMLRQWRQVVDAHPDNKPRVIMTECYTTFDKTIEYYGKSAQEPAAHFPFNFQLISYTSASSNASVFKERIDQWLGAMDMQWKWPNWVIGNHDNKRVGTRYPGMEDAMNMISLSLPGTAMTYYGEELGMTDPFISWSQTKDPSALNMGPDKYLRVSRDPCRTPMQWDDSISAGFSVNRVTWMPTNPNYFDCNVEKQKATSKSHLIVYQDLLKARQTETMKKGTWKTNVIGDNVLAITRSLQNSDTYVTLVNLGSWVETVSSSDLADVAGSGTFRVYTAGVNSQLSKGWSIGNKDLLLRPKESVVMTTAALATTSAPLTTRATTSAPETTTKASAVSARAVALVSLLLPLLSLRV